MHVEELELVNGKSGRSVGAKSQSWERVRHRAAAILWQELEGGAASRSRTLFSGEVLRL